MTTMTTMSQTGETSTHIFYQTYLDGQLVKLIKHKATGELFFDANSLAVSLGYADAQAMLADEYALEAINSYALENGGHAICHADGKPIWL